MTDNADDIAEEDLCGCGDMLVEGEEHCPACQDIESLFEGADDGSS